MTDVGMQQISEEGLSEGRSERLHFSWPKFFGVSSALIALKVALLGFAQQWDFVTDLAGWSDGGWSVIDWADWIALIIILVEGFAAGAAVTLAFSYISIVHNQTVQQTFNDMRTFFHPHAPAQPTGATTRMIIDPADAELVKQMLASVNDRRVKELGDEIAQLATQLGALKQNHESEIRARGELVT